MGDYGLTLAGMEIIGQVEIDEYCQKILSLRWPDVPKWKDIRDVKGEEVIKTIGRPDVISGGFPCTDISTAKNNAEGLNGKRSGLWYEQLRIIRELRPKYCIVENVSALLDRGLGDVLGGLAESGYDAEWQMLSSTIFGGHHRRLRIFIVAYSASGGLQRIFPKPQDVKTSIRKSSNKVADDCFDESLQSDGRIWPSSSRVRRVADGIANRIHRLKITGNGQDVRCVKWIGERIMEYEKTQGKV